MCTINWDLEWEVIKNRGILKEETGPHVLLESATSSSILHVIAPQQLAGRTITVNYMFPIVVKYWDILLYLKGAPDHIELKYTWEVVIENHWIPITLAQEVQFERKRWNGNDVYLTFHNPGVNAYRHWRLHITEGELTRSFFANQIYMRVE